MDTPIDSIVQWLKSNSSKNTNTNKVDNSKFIELITNTDATKSGFNTGENNIPFRSIIIQSFLSDNVEIQLASSDTNNNSLKFTVTTKNDFKWEIAKLNKINFTLNIVQSEIINAKKIELFASSEKLNTIKPETSQNNNILFKAELNPSYTNVANKTVAEITSWLEKGTTTSPPNETDSTEKTLNIFSFADIFYNAITTDVQNVLTTKNSDTQPVTFKKEVFLPWAIQQNKVDAKFSVEAVNEQASPTKANETSENSKAKKITITLTPKTNFTWKDLDANLATSKITFQFDVPKPILSEISLFDIQNTSEWNYDYDESESAYVFTNSIDARLKEFSWQSNDAILNWFKVKTPESESSKAGENILDEAKFVKLFYNDILLNENFTNTKTAASGGKETTSQKTISKEKILPHEIDDKTVDATVNVEAATVQPANYESSESQKATSNGDKKIVTLTLKPKENFAWAGLPEADNRKTIKFKLEIGLSEVELPFEKVLGIVKPYDNSDSDKGETVYWFESNSKELTFKYNQAAPTIKKLVSNAVFAGPNETEKLTNAAKAMGGGFVVADWQGNPEEQKSYKVSYINKTFDLGIQDNFNLFKELVINQTFRNRYSKNNKDDDEIKIFIPGSQLWYKSNNENVTKDELTKIAERINCSVVISISQDELKDNKKLANYQVSFRLKPKNGGNWKGLNNGNSIDIDVSFLALNFNSIIKGESTFSAKSSNKTDAPAHTNPDVPTVTNDGKNDVINFNGELMSDLLGDKPINSANEIAKLFSNDSNLNADTVTTNINFTKVSELFEKIQGDELINKGLTDSAKADYKLNKANLSFLYIDKYPETPSKPSEKKYKTGTENKTPSYIYSKNVNLSEIKVEKDTSAKADKTNKFKILLTFKLKTENQAKWFWGNWGEVYTEDNAKKAEYDKAANSSIKLSFSISAKAPADGEAGTGK